MKDLLSGSHEAGLQEALTRHTRSCPSCRVGVEDLLNLLRLAEDLAPSDVPTGFDERFYTKLANLEMQRHRTATRPLSLWEIAMQRAGGPAAALATLLATGMGIEWLLPDLTAGNGAGLQTPEASRTINTLLVAAGAVGIAQSLNHLHRLFGLLAQRRKSQ